MLRPSLAYILRSLVVHSDADQMNPIWMGERIYQAAPEPKQFVALHGLSHIASHAGPIEQWWTPVIAFIKKPRS